ncbi:Checkpoint protein hus1 [Malassezia sp. CBS 17886]|nr:Checkpoint protein hus1 [Malassezia sp. CBS 17886]
MRLRASICDVALFAGVARAWARGCMLMADTAAAAATRCYLQFTAASLRVICPDGREGVQVWATLPAVCVVSEATDRESVLFRELRVESNNNNEITVEVASESLTRILRTASGAVEVMIRLGKRDAQPYLTVCIFKTSHTGAPLDVTQELPVRILRPSDLGVLAEPMCPPPDVRLLQRHSSSQTYIVLPPLRDVAAIAEQMRPLSSRASVAANNEGAFRLSVLDSEVVGDATWTGLERPAQAKGAQPSDAAGEQSLFLNQAMQLENDAYTAGYAEGMERGRHFGELDGRALGREKGFELWQEVGYYNGMADVWKRYLHAQPEQGQTRKVHKQLQHIANLEELLEKMPLRNDSSGLEEERNEEAQAADAASNGAPARDDSPDDLQKLLERIRARYKLAHTSLGMQGVALAKDTNGRSSTASPPTVKIGGQDVDVSQLTY